MGGLSAERDLTKWRALDLGCLEGHYTELLCEAGFKEVVAIDLSPEQVARAHFLIVTLQGYSNAVVLNGSVEDREFMSSLGRFEVILFHGLLYHIKDPIGVFETLSNLMSDTNFLLLSTQFKFNFAEIVSPSPIANFKIRTIPADADGLVRYDQTSSTYATMATRLNPAALYSLLKQCGYQDVTAYDTPLGSRYGYHVHLIASGRNNDALRRAWNAGHDIPGLVFYRWHGDRLDGVSLTKGWRGWLSTLVMRAAYSLCERLGKSAVRQTRRTEIRCHSDNLNLSEGRSSESLMVWRPAPCG